MFHRSAYKKLVSRLKEKRRFIQILLGPRQTGKTTIARQVTDAVNAPTHYASADEPTLRDRTWLDQQWDLARLRSSRNKRPKRVILFLDEIHKVPGWSETVKRHWDDDTAGGFDIQLVLLGSSPLLVQKGLGESLAGRFEIIPVTHWSYGEMRDAFGWDLSHYVFYGGYPGSAPLINEPERWSRYIIDALIETALSRDILLMTRVDKPALLRRLFELGCSYSGHILSYQKMLGQLQDAGNTTTLAHYLQLLSGAGMLTGLQKFSGRKVRQRSSSPKLQIMNTALISAQSHLSFEQALQDRSFWGRMVESAVGSYLLNSTVGKNIEVFYWRERNREVDFVLRFGDFITALEVKSGRRKESLAGMDAFEKVYRPSRKLLIGGEGLPLEELLQMPIERLTR